MSISVCVDIYICLFMSVYLHIYILNYLFTCLIDSVEEGILLQADFGDLPQEKVLKTGNLRHILKQLE